METDKYLPVRGKIPRKSEIALWAEKKLIGFLGFYERWVFEGRLKITVELRREVENQAEGMEFWGEFMARIDVWTDATNTSNPLFMQRLVTFARNVLGFLKENPHAITEEIEKAMERNPRCHWALEMYRLKKGILAPTVQPTNLDKTNQYDLKRVAVTHPEVAFNEALLKATTLTRELLKGVKRADIAKMTTEDRLKLGVNFLSQVGKLVGKHKPNKAVFQQININSAKRADLEASFLKYAEQSMQDNEE